MAEVHLPNLEDHDEEPELPAPATQAERRHRRPGESLLTIGLEVILITAGVFLGLMGEQWRERSEQRELAEASLRRFRTEIMANRKAVSDRQEYHATLKKQLEAFFDLPEPRIPSALKIGMTTGLGPVFFEQAAWDLALATQALAHVDSELAFDLSRVYTLQQNYAGLQGAIVQSTVYGRSPMQDFEGFWRSLLWYFGDVSYFDPAILKAYDEVLPQIDRALGESPGETSTK
jgi:hypothetical protein